MTDGSDIMVVGVTDCGVKFDNYIRWLETSGRLMQIVKLSAALNNGGQADQCDGVVLTGGGDIHPRFFGRPDAIEEIDATKVDEYRDEFELKVVERLIRRGAPLFGICRGMQVVNVYQGGDIILDLDKIGKTAHGLVNNPDGIVQTGVQENGDRMHPIVVERGSQLNAMVGATRGTINSSHHQAVGRLGKELRSTAWSDDGIIEALEPSGSREGFLLLVQWHPERLPVQNLFSTGVRDAFLDAARNYGLAH
jgi:putative glutamine amidotransferase